MGCASENKNVVTSVAQVFKDGRNPSGGRAVDPSICSPVQHRKNQHSFVRKSLFNMQFSTRSLAGLIAIFQSASLVGAVCSNGAVAIGSPSTSGTSTRCMISPPSLPPVFQYQDTDQVFQSSDTIYGGSCNTVQTLTVTTPPGICDSQYFMCSPGTTSISQFDDPKTGRAYACSADAVSETCGSDKVTFCVSLPVLCF